MELGDRYGRLVTVAAVRRKPGTRHYVVDCVCDCGRTRTVRQDALQAGVTVSCGCYHRDVVTTHGDWQSSLYKRWRGMLDRCTNPHLVSWARYGGRGITVCDEWSVYEPFREWAEANGYNPALSLDRVDNDGGYNPTNCRWTTRREQANNRRQGAVAPRPRFVTAWGETRRLYEWASDSRCVVSYDVLKKRLRRGWQSERAMTESTNAGVWRRVRFPGLRVA